MSITTIARRYAEAVADVAMANQQVEQIDAELNAFAQMMKSSRELYEVFASPVLSNEQKSKVLTALVERAKPSKTTANLLKVMLTNYRLHLIDAVYQQFKREINERKGLLGVEVITAQTLGASEQDLLSRRLQELTGKQVQIQFKTDATLIGGVVTKIGSIEYDGSIRTQLETVKQKLKSGER
ncbi:MAG: ATP synthase F1 subunit delta [Acidobacteria bacterium]|nr:ATP synthase F1 subunit delta [Acidobacteriota bacterium]